MRIEKIGPENRREANCFIEAHWFTTSMAIRGELIDMTVSEGLAAYDDGEMVGLATFRPFGPGTLEITSFGSSKERKGVGGALLEAVADHAKAEGYARLTLVTTNDNLNALRFYQKRKFDLLAVYPDALERSRKLKPEIPLIGDNGIPLKHELELTRTL